MTAAQLWQLLTLRLERKVTKNNLAAVLLWYVKQPAARLVERSPGQVSSDQLSSLGQKDLLPTAIDPGNIDSFYGRTAEIAILTQWCLAERCRLILLVGMGGMGKTRLVTEITTRLADRFDRTIWRSLVNTPSVSELCTDLIQLLCPRPLAELPAALERQIELLIACLRQDRCLLVLDNVESILAGQVQCGQYLTGYDGYDHLFRALGELPHQSCAILTSREKPHTIARSEIVNPQLVRSLNLGGMSVAAANQVVRAHGCPQLPAWMWQEIHTHYNGNPLALKIATIAAVEMTGGGEKMLELYPLMKEGKLRFQSIDDSLSRQFDRFSAIEQQLVYWLAIAREPITGRELRSNLSPNAHAPGEVINALQSLARRCIAVCTNTARDRRRQGKWSIQPVMTAYAIRRSIDLFVGELRASPIDPAVDHLPDRWLNLNTYGIMPPNMTDRLRQTQRQSILQPIIAQLRTVWSDPDDLRQHLQQVANTWQDLDPVPAGYLVANVLDLQQTLELTTAPDISIPHPLAATLKPPA